MFAQDDRKSVVYFVSLFKDQLNLCFILNNLKTCVLAFIFSQLWIWLIYPAGALASRYDDYDSNVCFKQIF